MDIKKPSLLIKTILSVLAIICIIQAYFIYTNIYQANNNSVTNNVTELSSNLMDNYKRQQQQDFTLFDQFFNDKFFSRHNDPFTEIDRLHKQMKNLMNNNYQSTFNHSWDNWFNQKFSFNSNTANQSGIKIKMDEKNHFYLVTIQVPNLKNNQINVEIKQRHISIEGQFTEVKEKKNNFGDVISKSEMHHSISKMIPIPIDANYQTASIENKTDTIIVKLLKKPTA